MKTIALAWKWVSWIFSSNFESGYNHISRPEIQLQRKYVSYPSFVYISKILLRNSAWDLKFLRRWLWRIASSGILRRVALVRTGVWDELSASIIRVTRIGELGTTQAATSNRRKLRRNRKWLWATRRNNPKDAILRISHQHVPPRLVEQQI
jgi:hypothetical protein